MTSLRYSNHGVNGGKLANQLGISARVLISSGEFEGALDLLWGAVDSGSSSARLELANIFDECGLHAFSQDQYLVLMEEGGPEAAEASEGVYRNLIWMRDYKSASALAFRHQSIEALHGDFAAESEKEYSTLRFSPDEFSNLISTLLLDRQSNYESVDGGSALQALNNLVVIDESLFNLASDLKFGDSSLLSSVPVEVPIGGDAVVSRRAIDILGDPLERAKNYLQSCANLIGLLSTNEDLGDDEPLLELARKKGRAISSKLALLQEEFTLSDDDSNSVVNICWALQKSSKMTDRFSGFVLAGITND